MALIVYPKSLAFARRLQGHMDEQGLTRRALARAVDAEHPEQARRALNRHLKGAHMPSRTTRRRYAIALGLPPDTFDRADQDEEDEPLASLDYLLRLRIRQIVRQELDEELGVEA